MAITTMDLLVAAIAVAQQKRFYKQSMSTKAIARGSRCGPAGEPSAGAAAGRRPVGPNVFHDRAIAFTDAAPHHQLSGASAGDGHDPTLCNRTRGSPLHNSGFSGTNTGVQSVTGPRR